MSDDEKPPQLGGNGPTPQQLYRAAQALGVRFERSSIKVNAVRVVSSRGNLFTFRAELAAEGVDLQALRRLSEHLPRTGWSIGVVVYAKDTTGGLGVQLSAYGDVVKTLAGTWP
jgi:hypothetical protein